MVELGFGLVVSLINFVCSLNIFTFVTWISFFGLSFKFLRKEYLIWSGSGVMNMQDEDEIMPFLRGKFRKPTKCESCGQSTRVYSVPRPKLLCTKFVFYIYLVLIFVLLLVFIGSIVLTALFPAYSLYISPYLPTSHNLNQFSNNEIHTPNQLIMDSFIHRNFSTDTVHIPDNYRKLLNLTINRGEQSFLACKSHLEDSRDLLTLVDDVKRLSLNKEIIIQSLPPIDSILNGLNATFYPYLEYLPLQVPLIKDLVHFFHNGTYTYSAVQMFIEHHHVFSHDLLQLTVADLIDIAMDPISLIDSTFASDIVNIIQSIKRNMTELSSELKEKSTIAYNRGYFIIGGFFQNSDLSQFPEIPAEFLDMFVNLQQKIVFYVDRLIKIRSILPHFFSCLNEQGVKQITELKGFVISNYLGYFRLHLFYSFMIIIVIVSVVCLIVFVISRGVKLMKETLRYANSLLQATSEEAMDAMQELKESIQ